MITTSACKLWSYWPRCLVRRIQSSLHRTNLSGSATLGGTAHAQRVQLPVFLSTQTEKHFSRKTELKDFDHLRFLRFNDIHVPVRLECVKFASHCLMNHPDLAKDLTGTNCSPSDFDYPNISQLSIKVNIKLKLTLCTFLKHVFGVIVHNILLF